MIDLDPGRKRGMGLWSSLLMAALFIGVFGGSILFFSGQKAAAPSKAPVAKATAWTLDSLPTPLSATATPIFVELASATTGDKELALGQPAPAFTLPSLDGEVHALTDYRGRPVLINFWASWCPPCRVEMPDLVKAYEANKEMGFVILAVDLTFQDSLPEVEAFVEEFGMIFPVLLDHSGEVTNRLYRLRALPMSIFVDREGVVRRIHLGAMAGEQIDQYVTEILE